mmetsp:Transcript_11790/g.13587  ORF Transcript_11790/g.13587 Transcript_11790/m.13587 type:complete len:259 (-) Transcript_11790:1751-2527(-)
MLSSLAKNLSPSIVSVGKALEQVGRSLAGPAAAKFPESFGVVLEDVTKDEIVDYQSQLANSTHGTFKAPSASVDQSALIAESSSVWYNATVMDNVKVGKTSSLQDLSVTGSGTEIGSFVTVGAGASIGAKAKLMDRVIIGAGAKLGDSVVVESDAIVAPGAEIASGVTVKANEYWQGSPAEMVRSLASEEADGIVKLANHSADLASKHHMESLKGVTAVESQRERFSENPHAFIEDLSEVPSNNPEVTRRGLIFNDSQ